MIAHVVPVTRLRRATDWWSYKVPSNQPCAAGSLVVVPFRGHPTLGVVWDLVEEDTKASQAISEVLVRIPLVKAPHRRFIEWLAEEGVCSLSTALYQWLPRGLHSLPFTKTVREALLAYNQHNAEPSFQQMILTPSYRASISTALQERAGDRFVELSGELSDSEECLRWLAVGMGVSTVGLGRERALFAPWANLQQVIISEPEDISYYHEQIPYLNSVDAACKLADLFQATVSLRSRIPAEAAFLLWGPEATGLTPPYPPLSFTDLRRDRLLNEDLIGNIRAALDKKKGVLILYNAKDRFRERDGEKVILPGVQTLSKQLAAALGVAVLPPSVLLGTRSLFSSTHPNIGLTVALSLDPLLHQEALADQVHGWGDLGHLFSYGVPCILQSHTPEHPLMHALVTNTFTQYTVKVVEEQQEHGLSPFAESLVCSAPSGKVERSVVEAVFQKVQQATEQPWVISQPFEGDRRGTPVWNILLHAPLKSRVTRQLRAILAALPRPWKVQRNPWFTL